MTQSNLTIRKGNPERDYEIFADLLNKADGTQVTAETIRSYDNRTIEGDIVERYAACVDEDVIGYGIIYKAATAQKPIFTVWLTIAEAYRNQGHGQQFYASLNQRALGHGAEEFASECKDDAPEALKFAKKQGFAIRRHMFDSVLDLKTVNLDPFLHVVDEVKAQGIRFSSLAGEGNTHDAQYKLHILNAATSADDPSSTGNYKQTFENFQAKIINAPWFRADGQLLAIDGERYVGLGAIGFEEDGTTAFNAFTGVDKDYRGRKIAQALKVLGIQYAQSKGATRLETDNDSENVPMLSINNKLGFQRTNGTYFLNKTV